MQLKYDRHDSNSDNHLSILILIDNTLQQETNDGVVWEHSNVTILILIDNTLQQDLLKISGYVPESQSLF